MVADTVLARVGLRLRVAAVSAVTVGVALTIAAMLLVGLLRSRLDSAATTAATLRAQDIAALAEADSLPRDLALPGEESAFVQVVDLAGTVIASTENINGEPAISTVRPSTAEPLQSTVVVAALDEAEAMRVIALNADTHGGEVTVYAGESLEGAGDTSSAIVTVLAAGVPLVVVIVAAVTWWGVGRTLRPVRSISRTMADITASDLHRRVEVPAARDEIGHLAATVNDTLSRLDTAVAQQRRLVADASHELRGPLAALRADLEISVTHPDRTDWRTVARDTLNDVERLQRLTDDLLLLARLDTRQPATHVPVDLASVVSDSVASIDRYDIDVTKVGCEVGVDVPAIVDGDRMQLVRMVRNLVHNAIEHADRRLEITLAVEGDVVRLRIADDGPGIPIEQRQTVFDRFVRLDTARTRDTGGTGLGLAIVGDIVAGHHGTITITQTDPHGATFTVVLPNRQVT